MDPRDLATGNGVSWVDPLYINLVPGTNWGVPSGPSLVVTLDPQLRAKSAKPEDIMESDVRFLEGRARRKLMTELANEFGVMHETLLRELAR